MTERIYQVILVEVDPDSRTCATSAWYIHRHVSRELRRLLGKPQDVSLLPLEAALAAADAASRKGAVFVPGSES